MQHRPFLFAAPAREAPHHTEEGRDRLCRTNQGPTLKGADGQSPALDPAACPSWKRKRFAKPERRANEAG